MCLRSFISEEVFPRQTREETLNPPNLFKEYDTAINSLSVNSNDHIAEDLLSHGLRIYEEAAARGDSINSRAAALMTAIGLAVALVTGVGFTTLKSTSEMPPEASWAIYSTLIVSLYYLLSTVVLVFKVHGRVYRSVLDPVDLSNAASSSEEASATYRRKLAIKTLEYCVKNFQVNNRIVSSLWAAQKNLRNAVFVIAFGGLVASSLFVLSNSDQVDARSLAQALALNAGCSDLPDLKLDHSENWIGSCNRNGSPSDLLVESDGTVVFTP